MSDQESGISNQQSIYELNQWRFVWLGFGILKQKSRKKERSSVTATLNFIKSNSYCSGEREQINKIK